MIDGIPNRPLYFLPKGHYWLEGCNKFYQLWNDRSTSDFRHPSATVTQQVLLDFVGRESWQCSKLNETPAYGIDLTTSLVGGVEYIDIHGWDSEAFASPNDFHVFGRWKQQPEKKTVDETQCWTARNPRVNLYIGGNSVWVPDTLAFLWFLVVSELLWVFWVFLTLTIAV